jgi:hypothetical protein
MIERDCGSSDKGSTWPGVDFVIFKMYLAEKIGENLAILTQNAAN